MLELASRQTVILVRSTSCASLRVLGAALERRGGEFCALVEPQRLREAPAGATVLLEVRPEDAAWLNAHRPIIVDARLKLVVWCSVEDAGVIANEAPDFWDWISHLVEAPGGPHRFTRRGMACAGPRVAWTGGELRSMWEAREEPELPYTTLVADADYLALLESARDPERWLLIEGLKEPEQLERIRWALTEARRTAVTVLVRPEIDTPGWTFVHDRTMGWRKASEILRRAWGSHAESVALRLDLEPEAVYRSAQHGNQQSFEDEHVWGAEDPAVAMLRGGLAPVSEDALSWRAGMVTDVSSDEVRAGLIASNPSWSRLSVLAMRHGQWEVARVWADAASESAEDSDARENAARLQRYTDARVEQTGPLPLLGMHDLPPRPDGEFVGRKNELERIDDWSAGRHGTNAVLLVTGMGGIGKTRLALEYAYRSQHEYESIVWSSATGRERGAVLELLEERLGLSSTEPSASLEVRTRKIRAALESDRRILVVVDDVSDERLLHRWLPRTGGARVLVTSRQPMDRAPGVEVLALGSLSGDDAVRLLLSIDRPKPKERDEATMRALAGALGGSPLALGLAKNWLEAELSNEQVLLEQVHSGAWATGSMGRSLLEDLKRAGARALDLLALAGSLADADVPARLLQAALEALWTEEVPLDLLEEVCEEVVSRGWASPVERDGGIRLHPLVWAAARGLASERHRLAVCHALAREVRNVQHSSLAFFDLHRFRDHVEFLVIDLEGDATDDELVLARGWSIVLRGDGEFDRALVWCDRLISRTEGQPRGTFLLEAGYALAEQGRLADALGRLHEAISVLEHLDESDVLRSEILRTMGRIYSSQRRFDRARSVHERARSLVRAAHEQAPENGLLLRELSIASIELGELAMNDGHVDQALELFEESHDIARAFFDQFPDGWLARHELSIVLGKVGDARLAREETEEALDAYTRSVELARGLVNRAPQAELFLADLSNALTNLGDAHLHVGAPEEAEGAYTEGLEIAQKLVDSKPGGRTQLFLASFLRRVGDASRTKGSYEAALRAYSRSVELTHPLVEQGLAGVEARHDLAVFLSRIGGVTTLMGDFRAAVRAYEESLGLIRQIALEDPTHARAQYEWIELTKFLGDAHQRAGGYPAALEVYDEGLTIARRRVEDERCEPDDVRILSDYLEEVADLKRRIGQTELASELDRERLELENRII